MRRGGFARAIQTDHHDPSRLFEIQRLVTATEQGGQLIVENLDDLLAGRHRTQHFLAQRLVLDPGDEVFGDLKSTSASSSAMRTCRMASVIFVSEIFP